MTRIMIMIAAAVTLYGVDYKTFESKAMQRSPEILSAKLQSDIAVLEKDLALRYENPILEVEVGRYAPDDRKSEYGSRLGISQPFRVFGLQRDIKEYGENLVKFAKAGYKRDRAAFSATLRRKYTDYVLAVYEKRLLQEEIELAKRVEAIAKERYESGGGTKASLMQASVEKISAKNRLLEYEREVTSRYFGLLNLAGIPEQIELEAAFLYRVDSISVKRASSPDIETAKAKEALLFSKAKTKSRRVESYTVTGEIENEPEQSIGRIGVSLELPLFNRTNQEYRIAEIKARQAALQRERLQISQRTRLASLTRQLGILKQRYDALHSQLDKEEQLLTLFEEGYKMARSSLLDLIKTKNSLIETRRQLLETLYLANIYQIEIDYLKGKNDE